MAKNKTTLGQESIKNNAITNSELASDPSSLSKVSGGAATINTTNKTVNIGSSYGLNVAGNTNISGALTSSSLPSFSGVLIDEASNWIGSNLFDSQPYFEGEIAPTDGAHYASIDGYATINNPDLPFSKVALSTSSNFWYSGYIPVSAGETLYGEMWAMRQSGATGAAGYLYCGVERYDKDKKPIGNNQGTVYFVASSITVPSNGKWNKYNNTIIMPTTHSAYQSSDGGPVRYVRVRVLANNGAGTIPTYWGGVLLRRQSVIRDEGPVEFKGNAKFNKPVELVSTISGNQSGALRIQTDSGFLDLGPRNTAHSHIETDRTSFYFNKEIRVDTGNIGSHDEDLSLRTSGTTRVTIKSNTGNVGIGTTSPLSGLHNPGKTMLGSGFSATSANNVNILNIISGSNSNGKTNGITFWENASTPYGMSIGYDGTGSGNNNKICIYDSGSAEIITFQNGGNLGLGVLTPSHKLDVNGTARISGVINNATISGGTLSGGTVSGGTWSATKSNWLTQDVSTSGSPSFNHITVSNMNVHAAPGITLRRSGYSNYIINMGHGELHIQPSAISSYTGLAMSQAGNVSIGTRPSSAYKLYVNGKARIENHIQSPRGTTSATIGAGQTSATWTHNYGSTSYVVLLSPNTSVRHVYWSDKATNTIRINIDYPHSEDIIVDVAILGT